MMSIYFYSNRGVHLLTINASQDYTFSKQCIDSEIIWAEKTNPSKQAIDNYSNTCTNLAIMPYTYGRK